MLGVCRWFFAWWWRCRNGSRHSIVNGALCAAPDVNRAALRPSLGQQDHRTAFGLAKPGIAQFGSPQITKQLLKLLDFVTRQGCVLGAVIAAFGQVQ